ncbi:hypothetical protein ACFL5Z_16875 [Planctomycetota bacterium]
MMLRKNRNKSVGVCLTVVTSCLVLAVSWAILAKPETALAKKPDNPGGGGKQDVLHGSVTFRDFPGMVEPPLLADTIQSDGLGPYVHSVDFTEVGLGSFFQLFVKLKRDAGRSLALLFPDGLDPDYFPAEQNIWILTINKSIAKFRVLPLDVPVLWEGYLVFGQTGKDEAGISFGYWPEFGDSKLTVTRTGVDVWTIESLATDEAVFYRHGKATGRLEYGRGPMPFKITYTGQ